ncbi:MAG: hypothetical protein J6B02_03015 [Selenomonadales bacterium]|nr:hypothetical protein [Selenomonadales bacterium]
MSRGIGASAKLVLQDEDTVIYEYAPYDLNEDGYADGYFIRDGLIIIARSAFVEPEIREKIKRKPSGRKVLIVKCIVREVDYARLFRGGKVIVENSRFCKKPVWNGIDQMTLRLVRYIFELYQRDGDIPSSVGLHC